MRLRPTLITTILGLSALSGSAAGAQILGEQSTLLTAYVTEQATVTLPSRGSALSFPSGAKGVTGSVGVRSHRSAEDFRNFRVTWSWLEGDSGVRAIPAARSRATLPISGSVKVDSALVLADTESPAASNTVQVKVESLEL